MNEFLSQKNTDTVLKIIGHQLDVTRDQLTPDAKLIDDLGADSLDLVQITMALEEQFEITIPEEHANNPTVGDVCQLLSRSVGAAR
jgi:acyl carrier protein